MIHLVRLKLKLHPVMRARPTPGPKLSRASVCPGLVGRQFPRQAFSQATASHGTVFPPGDFPFLLGLPRSVNSNLLHRAPYLILHPGMPFPVATCLILLGSNTLHWIPPGCSVHGFSDYLTHALTPPPPSAWFPSSPCWLTNIQV